MARRHPVDWTIARELLTQEARVLERWPGERSAWPARRAAAGHRATSPPTVGPVSAWFVCARKPARAHCPTPA